MRIPPAAVIRNWVRNRFVYAQRLIAARLTSVSGFALAANAVKLPEQLVRERLAHLDQVEKIVGQL